MRIIPAIDIIEGKCVRLSKGDYSTSKIYNESPLEVARQFQDHGIEYLHLVDLDGARLGHIVNYRILEDIVGKTSLQIDFGGGLRSDADLKTAFESGASQITGGSIAVKNPEIFKKWISQYGGQQIILGADVHDRKVAVSGWAEQSEKELLPFVEEYLKKGIEYVICTDISKDGMLEGPSLALYQEMLEQLPGLKLIASGGITGMDDIYQLSQMGCEGAIIGKAIYEGRISLKQLEQFFME